MRHMGLITLALGLQAAVAADEPGTKYRLVSPLDDGVIATGLNGRGDVVGFHWVEDKEHPGIVSQVPFWARGKTMVTLPLLQGYTSTLPAAVSDMGLVVGRSSKPSHPGQRVHLRNQAFIWEAGTGIKGLGTLKGDSASYACGVTRDGTCISGVTVGDGRVKACVWEREGDGWTGTALPQSGSLGTQVVLISDDGRHVASADAEGPCLWSRSDQGNFTREVIGSPGSLAPRAVNNAGVIVGVTHTAEGLTHAVIWTRGAGITRVDEPKGYVRSEANAVNNAGVVVGMVDGPHGSPIGPNAFVFDKGRFRLIDEFGPTFTSANAINDAGQVAGVLDKEDMGSAESGGAAQEKPRAPGQPVAPAEPK